MAELAAMPAKPGLLDRLIGLPEIERPQLSPDGRWLAWSWSGLAARSTVHLMPTDGSAPAYPLTALDEDLHVADWATDSESLLLTGTRDGDEKVRLYRIGRSGGRPQPLTEPAPDYYINGGRLDPTGCFLFYSANLDPETGRPIEAGCIYRQDLRTGERRILARAERASRSTPTINVQGTHAIYTRNDRHPSGRQLWLVDIEGREDREIVNVGDDKQVRGSWCPGGELVLLLAETETHWRVGLWHLADGETLWLVDNPARSIEAAHWPRRSDRIVLVETAGARSRASLLNPESRIERAVPDFGGTLLPIGPLPDGSWLGRFYDARHPSSLVRFELAGGEPQPFLLPPRERCIEPSELVEPVDFRWRSVDGLEIQGWLYRPAAAPRGTVVVVHGGPTHHSENECDPLIQYLVASGFAVLDPNYRGSTGFGRAFAEAIKADGWGGIEQEDIRTGIEALIAAGIARPGRVGITGVSYGGYSSWCAITRLPIELCAAAAPICGMTDLVVDYETTRPELRIYSEEMMGGSPAEAPDRYRERSPIHDVDRIRGRLLIVQGLKDPNVTPENMRAVEAALQRHGVAHERLTFDDEGHGIHKPANRAVLYRRLAGFFARAFEAAP